MSRPTGYNLYGYGQMITDRPRMEAYAEALRRLLPPGGVVLDIGAGTGIFSLLAARLGAGQVHAVEPDDAIEVARQAARANGLADRITFYRQCSTEVNLPSRADLIISDLRGVLPLFQRHLPAIADARRRLLAPGGVLIPSRDSLWGALVQAPDLVQRCRRPWLENDFDLDLSAGYTPAVNAWFKASPPAEQMITPALEWAELDYRSLEEPDLEGTLEWTLERGATAHGLLLWFDAELAEGIGFSNAPGQPELIYGRAFFPLQDPVELAAGERVRIALSASLTGEDYLWQWRTEVYGAGGGTEPRRRWHQSTFHGGSLSGERLKRRGADHLPRLSPEGESDRFILDLIDGRTPLGEIARRAAERFPDRFVRWEEALGRAGELAERFGR